MRRITLRSSDWDSSLGIIAWRNPDYNVVLELSEEQIQLVKLIKKCLEGCMQIYTKAMDRGYTIIRTEWCVGNLYRDYRYESDLHYDAENYILVSPDEVLYVIESNDLSIRMAYNLTAEFKE